MTAAPHDHSGHDHRHRHDHAHHGHDHGHARLPADSLLRASAAARLAVAGALIALIWLATFLVTS